MSDRQTKKTPHRKRAPSLKTAPQPVTMDLLGLTADGRLVLWSADEKVQPISAFAGDTVCGHYVIEWRGYAVTAHLSNDYKNGDICTHFMGNSGPVYRFKRSYLEPLLLGWVIKLRASPQLALYQAHDLDPATVAALDLLREVALKLGLTPKPGTAPHVSPR